ncbi:hypothetical protein BDN72DRAFT_831922 [Pluteus cervinus]|uniref:Uncharacterized protein n=1 Tax=Pluteus cervinus TaxID=181527 RepID=A0ACD3BF14_9AGAR|nr:hypothetical protein BDN72DRAFT_831922 [Pluteus cervinus]
MEQIRKRMLEDANLYPEFGGPKGGSSSASVITVSSTSSTGSMYATAPRGPKNKAIVISDDESEVSSGIPKKAAQPQPGSSRPVERNEGSFIRAVPQAAAVPIHAPSNRDLLPKSRPVPPVVHIAQVNDADDEENIKIPDFAELQGFITPADAEKALRDLMEGAINDDEGEIDMEEAIVEGFREGITLFPHQVTGRKWMKTREDPKMKRFGGILADDMGLGKTIQTLTRIVDGRARKSDRDDGWVATTLIVGPLALVGQWCSEIEKMVPGYVVIKHHGGSRTSDPTVLRKAHVVVTTYDVVKSEHDAWLSESVGGTTTKSKSKSKKSSNDSDSDKPVGRSLPKKAAKTALFKLKWWRIVLDEAHNIKNHNTKGAVACCALEGKYRWCLTGTPMQNNVTEIFSLLKFLRVKPLNHITVFNEQVGKPVKSGKGAVRAMKRLQVVLKGVMLRRRKDQQIDGKPLIDLPPRNVNTVSCPFDRSEKAFYESLEGKMGTVIDELTSKSANGGPSYISMLLLLLRLRQACNHPSLVSKDYKNDLEAVESQASKQGADDLSPDADDLVAAFDQLGVTRKCKICMLELNASNTAEGEWKTHCVDCVELAKDIQTSESSRPSSAKIRMMLKLLDDIDQREGAEKTIIFSQFTSMLDLIEPFLKDRGIKYVRYDGSMRADQRDHSLEKIRTSKSTRVILISFKAGSTGLNLTACNNVILVDLWWNPALEDQAFDRAHRFGQTRDVHIYKLKVDDTVEDRILALQDKKRELTKAALSGDKIKNMKLGRDELLALFRPGGKDDDEEDF